MDFLRSANGAKRRSVAKNSSFLAQCACVSKINREISAILVTGQLPASNNGGKVVIDNSSYTAYAPPPHPEACRSGLAWFVFIE